MLEHGGAIERAARKWGIAPDAWLDLSTGINPEGYPVPAIPADVWRRLPDEGEALHEAARAYYGAASLLAVSGTQAALQALPLLRAAEQPGSRVLLGTPSYGEHARAWSRAGHRVHLVPLPELERHLDEAEVVVIVNPNNPTGDLRAVRELNAWHVRLARRGGWLVVDEAFIDVSADSLSLAESSAREGLVVLRSLGKFFGMAGARAGFVCAVPALCDRLRVELGPWHVSGPAQFAALAALRDGTWQRRARVRLVDAGARLEALLASFGITTRGTSLFRFWQNQRASALHEHLARTGILTRLVRDCDPPGLRFGLPGAEREWDRLARALHAWRALT